MKKITLNLEEILNSPQSRGKSPSAPQESAIAIAAELAAEKIRLRLEAAQKEQSPKRRIQKPEIMKIEIKHYEDDTYPNGVSHSEKTWRVCGIVVKRLVYHYPKSEICEVWTLLL